MKTLTSYNQKEERVPSERLLAPWRYGIERGRKMVDFLEQELGLLARKRILDVGCGGGGISIAFAERCKEVVALDPKSENINLLRQRIIERKLKGIFPLRSSALHLPFSEGAFDIVVINGVLEWVGYGKRADPFLLQVETLGEAFRVLRKSGVLYLAIENRWYPLNFLRDPHVNIPLVAILPRKIANWISYLITSRPYETPIYSYWKLKDMLKKRGFSKISVYAALIHYQYPVVTIRLKPKGHHFLRNKEINRINFGYKKMGFTKGLWIKLLFLRVVFLLNLAKVFIHSFIVLAHKK